MDVNIRYQMMYYDLCMHEFAFMFTMQNVSRFECFSRGL